MRIKKRNAIVVCASVAVTIVLGTAIYKTLGTYNMKYVLIFTNTFRVDPFAPMGEGTDIFHKRNCSVRNCYITAKEFLLNDNFGAFDAILFHGPDIRNSYPQNLPSQRSQQQIYIFTSLESAHNYPVPDNRLNNIFNFTWTYKLNSDISFKYMIIRNSEGKIIGPNETVDWIDINDMLPINEEVKSKLIHKNIAAAWFVSNCRSYSGREHLASKMAEQMYKYNLTLDLYGYCGGNMFCPRKYMKKCLQWLQRNYYFYFAFENSISEDYVTEKLRNALQNYVVPIVYGGADYGRFMPDGIYLNARKMSIQRLVKRMVKIIKHKELYYEFFKWHNHYSYHHPEEAPETDPYCSLCSFVNNVNQNRISTMQNLYDWWNPHFKFIYKNITKTERDPEKDPTRLGTITSSHNM